MRIGLIDVDSHNFPNLALMKISAWHKRKGDEVEWWMGLKHYDIVYKSKIFTDSVEDPHIIMADKIIRGGTGYGIDDRLPEEIEHIYPDYGLYGITDTAYGFLTRGCPRDCPFCIVSKKEGRRAVKVADLSEWYGGQKYIELLDPNILACTEWESLLGQLERSGAVVNYNAGLDVRLMTEAKAEAIARTEYNGIHFAWDRMKDEKAVKDGLRLFASHARRIVDHGYGTVYVLTNFETTLDEDLRRIYELRDMGYNPYVMIYNKKDAPKQIKRLQRWCNARWIFARCERFEDYQSERRTDEKTDEPMSGL